VPSSHFFEPQEPKCPAANRRGETISGSSRGRQSTKVCGPRGVVSRPGAFDVDSRVSRGNNLCVKSARTPPRGQILGMLKIAIAEENGAALRSAPEVSFAAPAWTPYALLEKEFRGVAPWLSSPLRLGVLLQARLQGSIPGREFTCYFAGSPREGYRVLIRQTVRSLAPQPTTRSVGVPGRTERRAWRGGG
jgi:hypothetical protein